MSADEPTVSALMPVHAGVHPDHLAEAVQSLLDQTRPVDEIVVVHDGPLDREHFSVLTELDNKHPQVVHVRLAVNGGAGVANQAGLTAAMGDWIVKVDADDICLPTRVERQLEALRVTGADLCGTAMSEFDEEPTRLVSMRSAPLQHTAIARRMRWNNPINHPTALYRRGLAVAAGGYPDWRYMQDYGLMARMLSHGARMMNLPDPLVLFRAGGDVTRRRRSTEIRRLEVALQRELRDLGLLSAPRMCANILWRTAFRVLPAGAVHVASRRILARPIRHVTPGHDA